MWSQRNHRRIQNVHLICSKKGSCGHNTSSKKKYSKSVQLQIYPNTPEVNQRLEVSKPDQILRWILVEVERRAEPQPIISFQLGMLR